MPSAISSVCQPAPSITTIAWRPGLVFWDIWRRCLRIMSLLTKGANSASVSPVVGHTAPNRCTYSNCCWRTALGLVPVLAHKRVVVFCWPKRASSWNQMSIWSCRTCTGVLRIVSRGNFFIYVLDARLLFWVLWAAGYPTITQIAKNLINMV